MNVTTPAVDSAVAELRAFLTGDMDTFQRLHDAQEADGRRAFAIVLTTACSKAVEKRFGEDPSTEDIIDFVSDARVRTIGPDTVPAEDAEKVLRAIPGKEDLLTVLNARARGAAQSAMLFALTHENDDAPAQIDDLLDYAIEQTEAYLRRRAAR